MSWWLFNSGGEVAWQDDLDHYSPPVVKCVCGTDAVMGKDNAAARHSDYCPKSPDYKVKESNETE